MGVKTAVQWIVVLGLALGAHDEISHGGARAVVRDVLDDGEAGAAVGAVGKGVEIAAVSRGKNLLQALGAGGDVRWPPGRRGVVGDGKTGRARRDAYRAVPRCLPAERPRLHDLRYLLDREYAGRVGPSGEAGGNLPAAAGGPDGPGDDGLHDADGFYAFD